MDRTKVINFLKDAIEYFKSNEEGVYYMPVETPDGYDRLWAFVVGYTDYGNEDYHLCVKIAENIDSLQCDYNFDWYMPVDDNNEVYDTEIELTGDLESIADYLLCNYFAFTGGTFRMFYYYHNQSQLFSNPNVYETNDLSDFEQALSMARSNKYFIVLTERV